MFWIDMKPGGTGYCLGCCVIHAIYARKATGTRARRLMIWAALLSIAAIVHCCRAANQLAQSSGGAGCPQSSLRGFMKTLALFLLLGVQTLSTHQAHQRS